MSFQNHEVWANASTPMFLQAGGSTPLIAPQITLTPTISGQSNLVLTNQNGVLAENGVTIDAVCSKMYNSRLWKS